MASQAIQLLVFCTAVSVANALHLRMEANPSSSSSSETADTNIPRDPVEVLRLWGNARLAQRILHRYLFAGACGVANSQSGAQTDDNLAACEGCSPELKKKLKNISGIYISSGGGCVGKKHSVGYVELVLGCY